MKKLICLFLLTSVALFASCKKDEQQGVTPEKLAKPVLKEGAKGNDHFTVEWAEVRNADSYTYTLDGGDEQTTENLSVNFSDVSKGDHTVTVRAVAEDSEKYPDSDVATITVNIEVIQPGTKLANPTLKIDESTDNSFTVSWAAVQNANKYLYKLDEGAERETTNLKAEFTDLEPGTYIARVKAVSADEDLYPASDWASIEQIIAGKGQPVSLAKPTLEIDSQDESSFTIKWAAVANADSYAYQLDGGEIKTTEELSVEFPDLEPADYTVKVKAVTEDTDNYKDSDWAEKKVTIEAAEPVKLAKPAPTVHSQTVDSFRIEWEAVENAASYSYVLDGGDPVSTDELFAEFTGQALGEHTFVLTAISDDANLYLNSDPSETVTVTLAPWFNASGDYTLNSDDTATIHAAIKTTGATEISMVLYWGWESDGDLDESDIEDAKNNSEFKLSADDIAKANSPEGFTRDFSEYYQGGNWYGAWGYDWYTLIIYAVNGAGETELFQEEFYTE